MWQVCLFGTLGLVCAWQATKLRASPHDLVVWPPDSNQAKMLLNSDRYFGLHHGAQRVT